MRTTEPNVITQGEQAEWTRSFCDYPATEWTVEYRFRGSGPGADVSGVADGSSFTVTLPATATGSFEPGTYLWQAWATEIADTNNTVKVDSGSVTVERGFSAGETGDIDLRTPAKIMLDTLDAALLAAGSADQIEYEITTPAGGSRVKRESRASVLSMRKYYATMVSLERTKERIQKGGTLMRNIGIVVKDR